jgi:hypothetical protein
MIIALYESNYPVVPNEEPDWQDLPIGHFQCDWRGLCRIETGEAFRVDGHFRMAGRKDVNRPRVGEHLLAAFSYKGNRYLYNATLSYNPIFLGQRKQNWWAHLGLVRQIRKW